MLDGNLLISFHVEPLLLLVISSPAEVPAYIMLFSNSSTWMAVIFVALLSFT